MSVISPFINEQCVEVGVSDENWWDLWRNYNSNDVDDSDDDDDDDDVLSADRVQGTTGINSSLLTSSFHGNAGPTAEGEIPKGGKGYELISCGFCEL